MVLQLARLARRRTLPPAVMLARVREGASMSDDKKRSPLFTLIVLAGLLLLAVRLLYGGRGKDFPDRSTAPALPASALERVAALDEPPGNIAVSPQGRIFFTYHPE